MSSFLSNTPKHLALLGGLFLLTLISLGALWERDASGADRARLVETSDARRSLTRQASAPLDHGSRPEPTLRAISDARRAEVRPLDEALAELRIVLDGGCQTVFQGFTMRLLHLSSGEERVVRPGREPLLPLRLAPGTWRLQSVLPWENLRRADLSGLDFPTLDSGALEFPPFSLPAVELTLKPGEVAQLVAPVSAEFRVSGRVLDAHSGAPLDEVWISASWRLFADADADADADANAERGAALQEPLRLEPDGSFCMTNLPMWETESNEASHERWQPTLSFRALGWETLSIDVPPPGDPRRQALQLAMEPLVEVRGTVRDRLTGQPIDGARLTLREPEAEDGEEPRGRSSRLVFSNAQGRYGFLVADEHVGRILVEAEGYADAVLDDVLPFARAGRELDVPLAPEASVFGSILFPAGSSVDERAVLVTQKPEDEWHPSDAHSPRPRLHGLDADGSFRMFGLAPGEAVIEVVVVTDADFGIGERLGGTTVRVHAGERRHVLIDLR